MNDFALVDTFNDFKKYWRKVVGKSLDEKIELWEREYMSKYPELLELQIRCYSENRLKLERNSKKNDI